MRNKFSLFLSTLLLISAATVAGAQTLPRFQATIVGSAPFSPTCYVSSLSDNGIMGGDCDPYGSYLGGAVVWRNGVATSLGMLPKGTYAEVHALNNFGVVVGEGDIGDGRPKAAFSYKGAFLETRDSGVNSRAIGITDSGLIFGNVIKGFDAPWTAAVWAPEAGKPDRYRATYLPNYNDGGDPTALNSSVFTSNNVGQAVGWINGSVIGQWGGFWNNDAAHTVAPLAPLPNGYHSIAWGVNDLGQAVGESSSLGVSQRPVIWQNDAAHTVADLGVLPGDVEGRADKINNAGQIVGWSFPPSGPARYFFYQNGAMAELSSLVDTTNGTWEITSVMALNNGGQMIASGKHDGVVTFNILLTPIQ